MIKPGYFLIKKITQKILSILIFSQLRYAGTHVVMTVWAFGGHWMQKTLDFKLMLQICEIDLFAYPTLTKRPAEIALPGCEWQQVSYMTWEQLEPSNWLKDIIKSDIYNVFYLKIW